MEKNTWPGMMMLLLSMQGAMKATVDGRDGGKARQKAGTRFVTPTLAGKEAAIMEMMRQKKTKTSMAEKLGVSRQTLRDHIERMQAATKRGEHCGKNRKQMAGIQG